MVADLSAGSEAAAFNYDLNLVCFPGTGDIGFDYQRQPLPTWSCRAVLDVSRLSSIAL